MSKITLAITTYNRHRQLFRTLQRLEKLAKPDELIIIDDGSEQPVKPIIDEFSRREAFKDVQVMYKYLDRPGYDVCSVARNVALKMCKTEYFMTSEPEILFISDVMTQVREMLQNNENRIISAGSVYALSQYATINPYLTASPQTYLANLLPQEYQHRVGWVATYTALYKTQDLLDINGWDEDFSKHNGGGGYAWDDTDLVTRLRVRGVNQFISKDIEVIHQWHEPAPEEVTNTQHLNEEMFLAKDLNNKPENAIANLNREWGQS